MTEVTFAVLDVSPEPYAVTPVLTARVGIAADGDDPVHAIALRCQVRIEPLRRGYTDEEAAGLLDLFGPRERWATTQHNFLWLHTTAMVQGFTGTTQVDLPLECTYDFEVTASKYFHALRDGHDPVAVPVQWNSFHQGRAKLLGAAGAVGPRRPLRPAGFGVARSHAAALSEHRLAAPEPRHPRRARRRSSRHGACSPTTTPSPRCWRRHIAQEIR